MEQFTDLHKICMDVFHEVEKNTNIFVLPLFLARVLAVSVVGGGTESFALLKGTVKYFMLALSFPFIMEILFSIPESFLPKFSLGTAPKSGASMIPYALDQILEVILASLYWVIYYLHVFFMLVMSSMAPIVFLTSCLLGFGLGLEVFLGLLIIASSWPIIWYGFDQVHSALVVTQSDSFGAKCLELILTLFKGVAPLAFAAIAVKSPAGRAISGLAKGALATTRFLTSNPRIAARSSGSKNAQSKWQSPQTKDRLSQLKPKSAKPEVEDTQVLEKLQASMEAKKKIMKGEIKNEAPPERNI